MGRSKIEQKIRYSKRAYDKIPVPKELESVVDQAMKTGTERKVIVMKRKRNHGWIAAAVLIFACFTAGLNTSQAFAAAAAKLPVIGAVSRVLTFRTYDQADTDKEIHMEIPQIQTEASDAQLTVDVNKEIERLMEQYKHEAEIHIEEYKQAFLATGGTEAEFAEKGIRVDAGYEVKCETEDTLSLVITANENWANAYGVQYFYNLDLKNGKEITLLDLLGKDYQEKADKSIRDQMKARMEQDKNMVYWDGSNGISGFEGVNDQTRFYINEKGNPVIVFEKYEVAPGAYGVQEFEIPV